MRLYRRGPNDVMFQINRCYFEAARSRAVLALERLRDLADQVPGDAHIVYAEGTIRRDSLGQGFLALEAFERAYLLAVDGGPREVQTAWFSAFNAAALARNESEHRRWAEIAFHRTPPDHSEDRERLRETLTSLDLGTSWAGILLRRAVTDCERESYGSQAAIQEVALQSQAWDPDGALSLHHDRALGLRALDQRDQAWRDAHGETFPAAERLALHEALREIERALALDEYDAQLWNYRSAWCHLLGRYEEAIAWAERAIALRPHEYPRPHINRTASLRALGRHEEATRSAAEAREQARTLGNHEEITQADLWVSQCAAPPPELTLENVGPALNVLIRGALQTSEEEMAAAREGGLSRELLTERFLEHRRATRGESALPSVPILADLLADFVPETALAVSLHLAERDMRIVELLLCAAMYIAAHDSGIQRRDAARYLVLMTLYFRNGRAAREYYRSAFLETAAAAEGPMAKIEAIVREELGRVHRLLPPLLADQEPVDAAGRARAAREVLARLQGRPLP